MSSCDEISSELSALRADIAALNGKFALKTDLNNYIPKAEKPQIINQSVQQAYGLIIPEANGYTDSQDNILKIFLLGVIGGLIDSIKFLQDTINGLASSIGKLIGLPNRVDKLEKDVDSLGTELSRVSNLAKNAKSTADTALKTGETALDISQRALQIGVEVRYETKILDSKINTLAINTGSELNRIEAYTQAESRKANARIDLLTDTVNEQSNRIGQIISRLVSAEGRISTNSSKINLIERGIGNLYDLVFNALSEIEGVRLTADTALFKADNAISEANTAIKKANSAESLAKRAIDSVTGLKSEFDRKLAELKTFAETRIRELEGQLLGLQIGVATALSVGQGAAGTANQALTQTQQLEQKKLDKGSAFGDSGANRKVDDLSKRFNDFVAQNNRDLGIKGLELSDLSKNFDRRFEDFQRLSGLSADARFTEFEAQNKRELGIRDLATSELSRDFNRRFADFQRLSKLDADARFNDFVRSNEAALGGIKARDDAQDRKISGLEGANTQTQTKLREQESMNREGLNKLDQILPEIGKIAGIPVVTAGLVKPAIPSIPQIGSAVSSAICNSFSGGCGSAALQRQSNGLLDGIKQNGDKILNGLNAGANAAQLALLTKIDVKLGAQIAGGISGKLIAGFKWLQIDRALNILTMATTIHNGVMLSNNIGQTLIGSINNVLSLVGLKDDNNQPFDVGTAINSTIQGVITSAIGAENYTILTTNWAKANRIYQSATNLMNSLLSMGDTLVNAANVISGQNARVANALRVWGAVGESAYGWMNPNVNFGNPILSKLQSLDEAANTVNQVTQEPLNVKAAKDELESATIEISKSLGQDDTAKNPPKPDIPEAAAVKATQDVIKAVSKSPEITANDLEADE